MSEGKRRGPSLLSGVLVLSVASLSVKIIGLLFKIPLSHLLGDEGMGYFNSAYTIYGWLYVIATAGLPIALSILISDASERGDEDRVHRIFRSAMLTLFFVGALGSLVMLVFSGTLARLIGSEGSRAAIFAIAPTLLFVSLSGGIRGYFQGRRQMLPTAISQLLEAVGKLAFGMFFGSYAAKRGESVDIIAAYAILGVTVATLLASVYLWVLMCFEGRIAPQMRCVASRSNERGSELGALLRIALPITVSASVASLTNLIDLTFLMNLLPKAGYSVKEATALFGNYSTLVVPVSHIPAILISPIASSLVPYLSAELAKGNRRRAADLSSAALRFASIITLPAMAIFALFGEKILSLVFDPTSAGIAAPILAALSPSIFFFGVSSVTGAILEANGKCTLTLRSMSVGAAVKLIVGFLLIARPGFGIYGAVIGSVACYATASVLNLMEIRRVIGALPSIFDFFAKPFLAVALSALLSVLFLKWMRPHLFGAPLTLALLSFIGCTYLVLLHLFRAILPEDLAHLPFISKLRSPKPTKD